MLLSLCICECQSLSMGNFLAGNSRAGQSINNLGMSLLNTSSLSVHKWLPVSGKTSNLLTKLHFSAPFPPRSHCCLYYHTPETSAALMSHGWHHRLCSDGLFGAVIFAGGSLGQTNLAFCRCSGSSQLWSRLCHFPQTVVGIPGRFS